MKDVKKSTGGGIHEIISMLSQHFPFWWCLPIFILLHLGDVQQLDLEAADPTEFAKGSEALFVNDDYSVEGRWESSNMSIYGTSDPEDRLCFACSVFLEVSEADEGNRTND